MDRLFLINEKESIIRTYDDLLFELNQPNEVSFPSKSLGLYETFFRIILSLLKDSALRFDEPTLELYKNGVKFNSFEDCLNKIRESKSWTLELATSGTTGIPKTVKHNLSSLTRNVKVTPDRKNDVWGFAYNPHHMAGLQVFFQAFFNQNPIVNLFGLSKEEIEEHILKYGVTHISATPTFYKLLLPTNKVFDKVKQVTFGGEKYNPDLESQLKLVFPMAKFTNVYASTEAGSLFAANGDVFSIRESLKDAVKIMNGEIWLHQSLLSVSDDLKVVDGWYATGDMVDFVSADPLKFKFISRKNEMINIGGSKVNPNEVEDIILKMNGVKDVKVFGKPNSLMGTILCADIIAESLSDKEVKAFVKTHLPEYMVPRIIKFVESVELTSTGKKSRV